MIPIRFASRETSARMWLDMKTVTPFLAGQFQQQFPDLDDAGRVQTVGGFIQQDQPGVVQQGFGQPQPLDIAQREHTRPPLRVGPQPQTLDGLADGLPGSARMEPPGDFQVLPHGQFGVGVGCFHQIPDPRPGFPAAQPDAFPENGGAPGGGFDHPQQHPDGGGLSGAVQPQEGIDLAFRHPQGKPSTAVTSR